MSKTKCDMCSSTFDVPLASISVTYRMESKGSNYNVSRTKVIYKYFCCYHCRTNYFDLIEGEQNEIDKNNQEVVLPNSLLYRDVA